MKKVLATIGAAALSAPAAGLAAAQGAEDVSGAGPATTTEATATTTTAPVAPGASGDAPHGHRTTNPAEAEPVDGDKPGEPGAPSKEAATICGALTTAGATGSLAGVAPALTGDGCAATVDAALTKLRAGDPAGALEAARDGQTTATSTTATSAPADGTTPTTAPAEGTSAPTTTEVPAGTN